MIGQFTNHLFQSTLFALTAALLVLAFRKNRARIRYALWLAASLKFLIPFSMLIALGSQIHWRPAEHAIATSPEVAQTIEQISEPFTVAVPTQPQQRDRRPFAIAALWFCGFACVMILRLRAWRGMRLAIRRSQPLNLGLPVEARLSSGVFEPGIVGLWRPTLLLPQGILERLTPSELEAVIAHELCHIRRRDNLFAAIHMAVEALFWFHPLVWWIGARLLDEREQACDEYVVSQGNQPDIYADAILNVCKLYTESPLPCVSGVTGADIRHRLETIMSNQKVAGLNFGKKTILTCAAFITLATPLTIGLLIGIGHPPHLLAQTQSPPAAKQTAPPASTSPAQIQKAPTELQPAALTPRPQFEVASIRPAEPLPPSGTGQGRGGGSGAGDAFRCGAQRISIDADLVTYRCVDLRGLIQFAYGITHPELLTGPPWLMGNRFDIEAKLPPGATKAQVPEMFRSLLEDRFKLAIHRSPQDQLVNALTIDKGGPKLTDSSLDTPAPAVDPNAPPCPPQSLSCSPTIRNIGGDSATVTPLAPGVQKFTSQSIGTAIWTRPPGTPKSRLDAPDITMRGLASLLQSFSFQPVVDMTGLNGRYSIVLEMNVDIRAIVNQAIAESPAAQAAQAAGPVSGPNPAIDAALQGAEADINAAQKKELQNALLKFGLRLEQRKAPIDTFIVDHVEKLPTEN